MNNLSSCSIEKIHIEKLFGKFNYEIPNSTQNENNDFSRILILYGDNGSGKTTILQIIYHLLSPISKKGHKTFIAKIPFKKFEIYLNNGIRIVAERKKKIIGSFSLLIYKFDIKLISAEILYDDTLKKIEYNKISIKEKTFTSREAIELDINDDYESHQLEKKFLKQLSKLDIALYLLSDDREFESSIFEASDDKSQVDYFLKRELRRFEEKLRREESDSSKMLSKEMRNLILRQAILRVEKYIMDQVNKASIKSELNINKIYSAITKNIIISSENYIRTKKDLTNVILKLEDLSNRSKIYSSFGLIAPIDNEEIIKNIEKASKNNYNVLLNVLEPYIDGLSAKLDTFQSIYEMLNTFTNYINKFYTNKKIEYDTSKGFIIKSDNDIIDFTLLSSGEKQLLLLFCNAFQTLEQPTIFIIDEPEISLNIRWQRELIHALLALTENSHVQFILATHSIELLNQYRDHTIKLITENTGNQNDG